MSQERAVIVIDSSGPPGVAAALQRVQEGESVVLVLAADEVDSVAPQLPDGPIALMVDDGDSRAMAVAAAVELAQEMFPRAARPEVVRA